MSFSHPVHDHSNAASKPAASHTNIHRSHSGQATSGSMSMSFSAAEATPPNRSQSVAQMRRPSSPTDHVRVSPVLRSASVNRMISSQSPSRQQSYQRTALSNVSHSASRSINQTNQLNHNVQSESLAATHNHQTQSHSQQPHTFHSNQRSQPDEQIQSNPSEQNVSNNQQNALQSSIQPNEPNNVSNQQNSNHIDNENRSDQSNNQPVSQVISADSEQAYLNSMVWGRRKRSRPIVSQPRQRAPTLKLSIDAKIMIETLALPVPRLDDDDEPAPPLSVASHSEIARLVNAKHTEYQGLVTKQHVDNVVRFLHKHGNVAGSAKQARTPKYTTEHAQYVCDLQLDRPTATYENLRVAAQHHFTPPNEIALPFSDYMIHQFLITHRPAFSTQRIYLQPWDRNDEETLKARKEWCGRMLQVPHEFLIFIDEAGFNIQMVPGFGRGLIGERIRLDSPNQKGPQLNMIAAMTANGIIHFECYYGTTDRARYIQFLQNLKRKCAALFRGGEMWAIQDGASIHKGEEVIDSWNAASSNQQPSHLETMPHYSPQLNAIEELWSAVKTDVREDNAERAKVKMIKYRERKNERERVRKAKLREQQAAQQAKAAARRQKAVAKSGELSVRTRLQRRSTAFPSHDQSDDGNDRSQAHSHNETEIEQDHTGAARVPATWDDEDQLGRQYDEDIDWNVDDDAEVDEDVYSEHDEDAEVPEIDDSNEQRATKRRRTEKSVGQEDLLTTVMRCAQRITPAQCQGWVNHAVRLWVKCNGWTPGTPAPNLDVKD